MKPLWKSKTFWTGLSAIVSGAALCAAGQIETGLPMIINGLGLIFLRDAIRSTAAHTLYKLTD